MLGKMRKALKVGNLLVPEGEDVFPAQIPHISSLSTLPWAQPFLGGSASRVEAFPPGPTHPWRVGLFGLCVGGESPCAQGLLPFMLFLSASTGFRW